MLATASLRPPAQPLRFVADELAALRVFVADDHDLYRTVIARAVARHPGLSVAGEARDGDAALRGIRESQPDVALLDLRMPGLDGLEVCARVRATHPEVAVVILTAFDDDETPLAVVAAGASAYLGKDAGEEEICAALLAAGDAARPSPPGDT